MQVSLIKNSFYFTYIFLITTGTICFIEALRNSVPQIRHIMNLETCISVVAGYFYGVFVKEINTFEEKQKKKIKIQILIIKVLNYLEKLMICVIQIGLLAHH